MKSIYINWTEDGQIAVRVMSGAIGDKTKLFSKHPEADKFAISKMGKTGMVVDNTLAIRECRCGDFHPLKYTGDCRNDKLRFPDPEVYAERLGVPVKEITVLYDSSYDEERPSYTGHRGEDFHSDG